MGYSRYMVAMLALLSAVSCGRGPRHADQPVPAQPAGAPAAALGSAAYMAASDGIPSQNHRFVVQVQWENRLKAKHVAVAKLIFADAQRQRALAVDQVQMQPQLVTTGQTSALMGSLQITADPVHPGVFTAGMVLFPRRGRWDLRIAATSGGVSDTAHVSVWVR